jgi:hypothetical protein
LNEARLSSSRGNLSMNQSSFAITRFQTRNGVISWRVDGRLHGVRIRKNFQSREEAIADKATQELKALQADAGLQSATTFLSEEQLREAETAFNRIKNRARRRTRTRRRREREGISLPNHSPSDSRPAAARAVLRPPPLTPPAGAAVRAVAAGVRRTPARGSAPAALLTRRASRSRPASAANN